MKEIVEPFEAGCNEEGSSCGVEDKEESSVDSEDVGDGSHVVDSEEGSRTLPSVEVVAVGGPGSEELDEESQVEVPVIKRVPGDSMSVTGESGGIMLLSESVPIMAV